jgi:hypothetical protein
VVEALGAAVLISIPSVILYAFCQVVDDVRDMRDNIREVKCLDVFPIVIIFIVIGFV